MPDYSSLFRITPSPDPAGWTAAPGGIIELKILIVQGPCTNLNLRVFPAGLTFVGGAGATDNRQIIPSVPSGGIIFRQIRLPSNVRSGNITLGGVVTTRDAGWPINTSPNSGPFRLTVVDTPEPPLPPADGGTGGLSWFQAEAEGLAGTRIRRAGWANRYLEHTTGIWWVQFFSPTTKTLGERRVVRATDFVEADFRARDWTHEGITGQHSTAGSHHGAIVPTLRFP